MIEENVTAHETTSEEPPPLEEGAAITPGYEVIEHLHRSNYYDVYDVWSEERACRCIAKTPRPDHIENPSTQHDLIREGRILKRLTHPHIVRAYEILKEPHPVVILETLSGATLAYLIDTLPRRLPLSDIAHLGIHLCSAVHYLHRHNVLHLDLKPSNIMSERQLAKIMDLSLARPPGRRKGGAGTKPYMAPEQACGGHLNTATDVWGIGAVLFEATTGEVPFNAHDDDEDDDSSRFEQLERRAESVRAYRRVPASFASVVEGCLAPEPERRPKANDLIRSLTAFT